MKVTIVDNKCRVEKEAGDPIFRNGDWRNGGLGSGESRLLYHVKNILNKQGYNLIKKRMWKDGHMVSDEQLYLRSRTTKSKKATKMIAIWNPNWQICGADDDFNRNGVVELQVDTL